MVLEATVLLLDNSEWSRNGDFYPSRLFAQNDCAQAICTQRRNNNLENTLAIIAMAGGCPRVMISLANDGSKLQHAINSVQVEGEQVELTSALNIAQLILKHRQNPNQHQRIMVFVGSPLPPSLTVDQLTAIGKGLKKNGVAIDVISYGPEANFPLLHSLVQACSVTDAQGQVVEDEERVCRLIVIPPGESLPDTIRQHLLNGSSVMDIDGDGEEMDPELALALKLSLEEEEARQRKQDKDGNNGGLNGADNANDMKTDNADDADDEEAMLQQAIAISMMDQQQQQQQK